MAPWSMSKHPFTPPSSTSSVSSGNEDGATTTFRAFANTNLDALTSSCTFLRSLHSATESPNTHSLLQTWQLDNASTIAKLHKDFPPLFSALLDSPTRKAPGRGNEAITPDHLVAARLLLLQARNANTGTTDPDKIIELYQDHGENMLPVSGPYPIRASGMGGWLGIDWFRQSAYSPIQLEQHEDCHQHGTMWRAAFEDLLVTALDKEPVARAVWEGSNEDEEQGEELYKAWGAVGMDWMLGLQVRGLLPPQLPSLYNISGAEKKKLDRVFGKVVLGKDLWTPYGKGVKREVEKLAGVIASLELGDLAAKNAGGAGSELDIYEYFMGEEQKEKEEMDMRKQKEEEHLREDKEVTDKHVSAGRDVSKEKLVGSDTVTATLTTKETTTLPDGTTHTR